MSSLITDSLQPLGYQFKHKPLHNFCLYDYLRLDTWPQREGLILETRRPGQGGLETNILLEYSAADHFLCKVESLDTPTTLNTYVWHECDTPFIEKGMEEAITMQEVWGFLRGARSTTEPFWTGMNTYLHQTSFAFLAMNKRNELMIVQASRAGGSCDYHWSLKAISLTLDDPVLQLKRAFGTVTMFVSRFDMASVVA